LATAAMGGIVYMVLLLCIDKEARNLAINILREVRGWLRYRV
jgi:hypothetical protein